MIACSAATKSFPARGNLSRSRREGSAGAPDARLQERAARLLRQEIDFIHSPEFVQPEAERKILEQPLPDQTKPAAADGPEPKGRVAPFFAALYRTRLLTADEERGLFRRMNYLKFRANVLRARLEPERPDAEQVARVEQLLAESRAVRERLIHANLRLVVSIARGLANGRQHFEELVSEGNLTLINAIDKFDYARGFRFSTYATHAIRRAIYRQMRRGLKRPLQLAAAEESLIDPSGEFEPEEDAALLADWGRIWPLMSEQLDGREQYVVRSRFGLEDGHPRTLRQIGREIGLSKERVRQLQLRALDKLQRLLTERQEAVETAAGE